MLGTVGDRVARVFKKAWIQNKISASSFSGYAYSDLLFAAFVLSVVGFLIFPIPPLLMDFLLSISIAASVLLLVSTLFIDRPLDLSAFPSILLVVTMLRLSLNVSTTRLILLRGHLGTNAAGHVVEAFGCFVTQGSVVIGTLIFIILTIINFIVITKGSGRIAEVAARFSLDALPGKQMAIDADLSAGLINENEARERRKVLEEETAFYGAMDGASKFVRGDAVSGLLITFINFVAGIVIGVAQRDMTFFQAIHTYTILTIGDGLVTQIPSLLVSTAAGFLVTKSGVHGSIDKAIRQQLSKYPQSFLISAGLLLFMAIIPGTPFLPFTFVASLCGALSYFLYVAQKRADTAEPQKGTAESLEMGQITDEQMLARSLNIDIIRIELGYELLTLINYEGNNKITDQIKVLRNQIAQRLGFVLPAVRIQDNADLAACSYRIKIKEVECAEGTIYPDKLMTMNPSGGAIVVEGIDAKEPTFGLSVKWIEKGAKEDALFKGYTVVEPPTVIITHLTEMVKENVMDLLTYAETQKLIEQLSSEHKKLASDLIPSKISLVLFQRVLQALLNEGISIRDLPAILEAVSEFSDISPQVLGKLIEHVRVRLTKQICFSNMGEHGYIPIVTLSPQWERAFIESLMGDGDAKQIVMSPSKLHEFVSAVNKEFEKLAREAKEVPVILTSGMLRPFIRSIIERFRPNVVVLSQNEIHSRAKIKTLGSI